MSEIVIIILIISIALIYLHYYNSSRQRVSKDGFTYTVNDASSVDTLAGINQQAIAILRLIKDRVSMGRLGISEEAFTRLTSMYELLRKRFNPDGIEETSPLDLMTQTSYTDGKGQKLAMCLKCEKCRKEHSPMTLTLVLAHELTHMATEEYQHPPEFWARYDIIRDLIAQAKWFEGKKEPSEPVEYCGKVTIKPSEYKKLIIPQHIV